MVVCFSFAVTDQALSCLDLALVWAGFGLILGLGLVVALFRSDLGLIWLTVTRTLVGFASISAYHGSSLFIMAWLESHIACMIL